MQNLAPWEETNANLEETNANAKKKAKVQSNTQNSSTDAVPLGNPGSQKKAEGGEQATPRSNSNNSAPSNVVNGQSVCNPLDDPEAWEVSDGEEWDIHQNGDWSVEDAWGIPPEQEADIQCVEVQNTQKQGRKRLAKKTKPALTAYAHIKPRGFKHEQANRKRKNQEILIANTRQKRKQLAIATSTIASNIGMVTERVDREGISTDANDMYDWNFAKQIHSTHEIQIIQSSSESFFCTRCGYYNDGGQLRSLRKPCPGFVASERKHLHRLLRNGQLPNLGTKLGCGRDG